jgi:hypothetical protein
MIVKYQYLGRSPRFAAHARRIVVIFGRFRCVPPVLERNTVPDILALMVDGMITIGHQRLTFFDE